jgi:hypothetical protein
LFVFLGFISIGLFLTPAKMTSLKNNTFTPKLTFKEYEESKILDANTRDWDGLCIFCDSSVMMKSNCGVRFMLLQGSFEISDDTEDDIKILYCCDRCYNKHGGDEDEIKKIQIVFKDKTGPFKIDNAHREND